MKRQVKKKNGSKWIAKKKRKAIYDRDNHTCAYCDNPVLDRNLTLDHVLPEELGGTHCHTNLVVACRSCNQSKGEKSLDEFLAGLKLAGVDVKKIRHRLLGRKRRKLSGYRPYHERSNNA